ncbi:MAG: carboxylesterase family protein [Lachnospiraceae bacterium]|nr:carboxylesterase family protein [Lachnospiraceae bacterium]
MYGVWSLQPNFLGVQPRGTELTVLGSEDCLFLNVWTKHLNTEESNAEGAEKPARCPVVIYVHGGGFQVRCGGRSVTSLKPGSRERPGNSMKERRKGSTTARCAWNVGKTTA